MANSETPTKGQAMFKKSEIDSMIDAEITTLLQTLAGTNKDDDEYKSILTNLATLHELRHKSRISKETLATIGANLAGIVVILSHERAHVIASKAFGLVKKIF